MTPLAERVRQHRDRERHGLVWLPLVVEEDALHAALLKHRLITRDRLDDRAAVAAALARAIGIIARHPVVED